MKPHNKDVQVLMASAARTATSTVSFVSGSMGCLLFINATAAAATPSVVFTLQGVDPASDATYTILASAAITGVGQTILRVHPELTGASNTIAKDMLPHAMKLVATHADADSITYSVGFVGVN